MDEEKTKTKVSFKGHPLYNAWKNIRQRVSNKNRPDYKYYGGKGIILCDEWKESFTPFYEWSILNGWEKGLSIDRIDVNGNYEPDNCRWTTHTIQTQNNKSNKSNNTSGFRGVYWSPQHNKWRAILHINKKSVELGLHKDKVEAAKAYERYVRLNNLEHNFTPALTEEEVEALYETKN